jgi:predicted membrane-bound mannosyltransferase
MNRWSALALLLAIVGALFLRTPDLGNRPLHNDESTNAIKLAALWDQGDYRYDPHEYHGPTLHYFALPFLWLGGVKTQPKFLMHNFALSPSLSALA